MYETPADFQARTDPAKSGSYWAGYDALAKALAAAGVIRGGAPLQAPETGEAVRVRSGETARTPLAPRVEQLSGWFLIEAPEAKVVRPVSGGPGGEGRPAYSAAMLLPAAAVQRSLGERAARVSSSRRSGA